MAGWPRTQALEPSHVYLLALNSCWYHSAVLNATYPKVHLSYPPTPAHLCLLLSMFQISTESGDENGSWHSKTTLPILPSLFVLHEPSLYFLSRDDLQPNACVLSFVLSNWP